MMDIGLLIVRAVVGGVMVFHGTEKLFGWWGGEGIAGAADFFGRQGFRPPRMMAAVAGLTETGGGLLLACGALTPLGAVMLVGTFVNILVLHLPNGLSRRRNGFEYELVLLAGTLGIAFAGSGSISVDAAAGLDPFRTLMIEKLGARPILDSSVNELAAYPVGGYVVSATFAEEHGNALTRFQRALRTATEFANANPAAVREALPKFANVDAEVANRVVINRFVEAADTAAVRAKIQTIADAMRAYQMVSKPVDVAGFLA